MIRIPYEEAVSVLAGILVRRGFDEKRARISAGLFADANRDGVLSHGLDRFGSYLQAIEEGLLVPSAEPILVHSSGALEQWDGRSGPGNLNARTCMARALELSGEFGVGCVGLRNTNHWMRGGNYGWQAAESNKIGICWTNTMPNLPPWGSSKPLIGNNPIIIAVPREDGPIVLDMAISQFSYGALSRYAAEGSHLPVPGGYDSYGKLTTDPAAVAESMRPLPIGFWKGSGLSILLDLVAASLSGGKATCDIEPNPARESGVSQVFLAFSPPDYPGLADRVAASLGEDVRYPGRETLERRRRSEKLGIPADEKIWSTILGM